MKQLFVCLAVIAGILVGALPVSAQDVVVKHFCNRATYIFKNDIELHKEFDNHYMNVAYHGCTNHRQILRWNL